MPNRQFNTPSYRYGFNGKENDNEVKGVTGSQQDYGLRIYDGRLAKFLSADPLCKDYPDLSPYQFASNKPIYAVDLDGAEALGKVFSYTYSTPNKRLADQSPGSNREHYENLESRPIGKEGDDWVFTTQQSFLFQQGGNFKWFQSLGGIRSYYDQRNVTPRHNSSRVESTSKSTIENVNADLVKNEVIRSINFASGTPNFGPGAISVINGVADIAKPTNSGAVMGASSPPVNSAPVTSWSDDGLVKTVTETSEITQEFSQIETTSKIEISFKTARSDTKSGRDLMAQRYNKIRDQLISQGVPASNISQGQTQWRQKLGATDNQTIFNIDKTTTTTTGSETTTTTKTSTASF